MALFNYECDEVKRIIDEVSPNYPQLTTFEKEWLFFHKYGYIPGIPVELEYETVNVNPNGTVLNAIPFPYKSVILKGNTLVNIKTKYNPSPTLGNWFVAVYDINTLKINTKYIIKVFNKTNIDVTFYVTSQTATGSDFEAKANSIGVGTITTKSVIDKDLLLRLRSSSEDVIGFNCDILLLEYQEGMENWDIPYFTGMSSVKMPVLTTTGKNLVTLDKLKPLYVDENGTINYESLTATKSDYGLDFIKVEPNTTYTLSTNIDVRRYEKAFYDLDKNFISRTNSSNDTFTTPLGCSYVVMRYGQTTLNYKHWVQLEQGSVSTSYEPHHSNILTVNESVELCGIGDVKDELNLITGELTERIGEIVLDGSENWNEIKLTNKDDYLAFGTPLLPKGMPTHYSTNKVIDSHGFSKLQLDYADNSSRLGEAIIIHTNGTLYFRMLKTRLSTPDINGWLSYLQSNPITLNYILATESVKTVDLTKLTKPYEGVNHYHLTSNIPCEAILEVPVVSTGEQTLKEINNY